MEARFIRPLGLFLAPALRRIFDLLADGNCHRHGELIAVMRPVSPEESAEARACLIVQMSRLRKLVASFGFRIETESGKGYRGYRLVQHPIAAAVMATTRATQQRKTEGARG